MCVKGEGRGYMCGNSVSTFVYFICIIRLLTVIYLQFTDGLIYIFLFFPNGYLSLYSSYDCLVRGFI